ncbi:MAG TPA: MFS transporter [Phycisphaerae bacterium]|nr:MFS transporter [Phycisphaerae bacterium]HRW52937.1 MFS transporter [Phycisphaerae bacterium]
MADTLESNASAARLVDATVQRTLTLHICAELMRGAAAALAVFLPFLARKHFNASVTETFILTVSMPVMQFFTIYWHRVFQAISMRAYIAIIGLTMSLPLLLMSQVTTLTPLIVLWLISAFGGTGGGGAITPVTATILRTCYPESYRGRAYGLIGVFRFAGIMLGGYLVGRVSVEDPTAYRYYLPIMSLLLMAAMCLYIRIAPQRDGDGGLREALDEWWKPVVESLGVLRVDRNFRAYEGAYMLYGVGWMICYALLPLISTDRLLLNENDYSLATTVALQAMMIVLLFPAGRIADRVGPVRLVSVAFLILTAYPLLLAIVWSFASLAGVTVFYAIGMVGVHLGWTLGPVHFAPDTEQAPRYLAVHATLVGVRGIVFQGLGVWLYAVNDRSAVIPLLIASVGFFLAAIQMRRLGGRIRREGATSH